MSEEQTNQSGIVGEIVSEFHKLEEKVEHLIHPSGDPSTDATVGTPPTGLEPVDTTGHAGAGDGGGDVVSIASAEQSGNVTEALASSSSSSTENQSGSAPTIESGNDAAADVASVSSGSAATANVAHAMAGDIDPNVGASIADTSYASDTPSSVEAASQIGGTLVTSGFASLGGDALKSIQNLRRHLWTFEHSAVASLHADLDKLEAIFK